MTQRVVQWSSPWVLERPVMDPQPVPWEAPQKSPLMLGPGDPGPASWSIALSMQNDFYVRSPAGRVPAWADSGIMGFYPSQPYMTPGVRPGIGGGWRAYTSGFPEAESRQTFCERMRGLCLLQSDAPLCEHVLTECSQK